MRKILLALAVSVFACGTASASDKTDVMAAVHQWVNSFNQGDVKTMASMCSEDAVVVDDFPPHVWQGGGACAGWAKGYSEYAAKASITDPVVRLGKVRHLKFESGYAYLVVPTTYTYKVSGKAKTDGGMVTLTLHKGSAGWQITAWAWADQ